MASRWCAMFGRRAWILFVLVAVLFACAIPVAQGAEFAEGEQYVLPVGQTVTDDLYVSAGDVRIDGTVQGDLIAFGGYVEINGEVTGDLITSAGGVTIDGTVGDDVRAAAGGITVNGTVGDDLLAAGGGTAPGGYVYPINIDGRRIDSGIFLNPGATVGGDAYLVGGTGIVAGTVAGDLFTGMNDQHLLGKVGGDAALYGNTIAVADAARVEGKLTYQTSAEGAGVNVVPPGVSTVVAPVLRTPETAAEEPLANRLVWWTIGLARVLLGLLVLGALLLALLPHSTGGLAGELQQEPWHAAGYGLLFVLVMIPLGMLLVTLAWLFWGALPGGLAVSLFLLGLGGILWIASPAITGFWLGRLLLPHEEGKLLQLFAGGALILLAARAAQWIPVAGWLISVLILLASFVMATGAILAYYRRSRTGDIAAGAASPPAPPIGMQPTPA